MVDAGQRRGLWSVLGSAEDPLKMLLCFTNVDTELTVLVKSW